MANEADTTRVIKESNESGFSKIELQYLINCFRKHSKCT
jgi:hypothetical protein